MSSLQSATNYAPQFKGYRIRQNIRSEQDQANLQQTLLKIIVRNQANGIPKIRNDVICNGKHYPFIPLFSFTSEEDLTILEQISTIVLRDENQILCEILSGRLKEIRASQFKELKQRFKSIFSLDLKVEPEQLFLILISDEITKQTEFNEIFDSISETQFVNVLKKIYENCPSRVIPKILRKIAKYFNSTKARPTNSIERLKRLLKIIKSADQATQVQQKQEPQVQLVPKKQENQEQEWIVVPKNKKQTSTKKQSIVQQQKSLKVQQTTSKKVQQPIPTQKTVPKVSAPVQLQKITKKVTETQKIKKTQKVTKKQKVVKAEKSPITKKQAEKLEENEQNWEDVDGSQNQEDEDNIKSSLGKMAFHADESDEDLKYLGPKKKSSKPKNNITVPLDPEFQRNQVKKAPYHKKQKKNNYQSNSNGSFKNQGNDKNPQANNQDQSFDRRNNGKQNYRNKNEGNGRNNNNQSLQKGRGQFNRDSKKIDGRILLGINGASDAAWRQRMRPPRYPNRQNNSYEKNRGESVKENRQTRQQKGNNVSSKNQPSAKQTRQVETVQQQSKNLTLKKIYSIPEDLNNGKQFKFEKRNYNLFVNKLFWVNTSDGQVTIQKDGKGYIRKCPIEIIDDGKALMADGVTINTDGLSNLEDGGTAFGEPVFEEFTPNGQWFLITSLDVFAYV